MMQSEFNRLRQANENATRMLEMEKKKVELLKEEIERKQKRSEAEKDELIEQIAEAHAAETQY
jgi:hypothetical protein